MEQVRFTEEETKQLAEAHAIRQRVRAARRARQAEADSAANTEALRKRKQARDEKSAFDTRVRNVLLDLTYKMKENKIHLVTNPLSSYGLWDDNRRLKVFTMVDAEDKQPNADIYWVFGKGFEWA